MKYRKKSVEVEAMQLPKEGGYPSEELVDFLHTMEQKWEGSDSGALIIHTLEGSMTALPGDYIIKGVEGEFYPCKPGIFEKTYEAVS